ncbi:competence type IV pilus minor pilin ComGG [Evansella sp. AB-P1]|uniref:competence type IV pilus minor pilin ComGG n=1 Tax=Evansella sp. AB-P1 TaxID=3037653 RepID=UPI00241C0012|nr:competence type IV pilus minor pilin ComGG [Evansella sp. AB-P1]MDG5788721.1 competence type IV pilus minor pilin ComGG [Evansella sp. AB-P1]
MSRNRVNGGFALLLSILILFVLSASFIHYLAVFESEKRFFVLEKEVNSLDHMLISALEEVLLLMEEEDEHLAAGKVNDINGTVHYTITHINQNQFSIVIVARTISGSQRGAKFTYHIKTGILTNWTEGAHIQ